MTKAQNLLQALISDQKNTTNIYKPGPYWWKKSLLAARELENNGLIDFRSSRVCPKSIQITALHQ